MIILCISFFGCSEFIASFSNFQTGEIETDFWVPAQIKLPSSLDTLIIVNRLKPSESINSKFMVESVFDRYNSTRQALEGLHDILDKSPRLKIIESIELPIGADEFNTDYKKPLSWEEAKLICKNYKGDAIICLENLKINTKFDLFYDSIKRTETKTVHTSTRVFWRIYYPKEEKIIDNNYFSEYDHQNEEDRSAYICGSEYAKRISPYHFYDYRNYYEAGNDQLKAIGDSIRKNKDWDYAIKIWERMNKQENTLSVKRMATYNLIVAYERKGDLGKALQLAYDGAYDLKDRKILNYITKLRYRINCKKLYEEQTNLAR